MKSVRIRNEYITLGQFLKLTEWIQTGGEAKFFLAENRVEVNGAPEQRRGKKLYPADVITIDDSTYKLVSAD